MTNKQVRIDPSLRELIPKYLLNRRRDLAELQIACQCREMARIKKIGHDLKGLGESYGFVDITLIGAAIEKQAAADDVQGVKIQIQAFSDYLESIEIVYEA